MSIQFKSYWIRVTNDSLTERQEEGKWVVFLPKRLHSRSDRLQRQRAQVIQEFIERNGLIGALVTRGNFDLAVFFTSANRADIWKVKRALEQDLDLADAEFMWKAGFETDNDWEPRRGDLWFLSELEDGYQRIQSYLVQNRREKAKRIEANEVLPLITDFRKHLLEANALNRKSMVVEPVFSPIEYKVEPRLVFVLMPFGEEWSPDFYHFVRQVGEDVGLEVVRADDIFNPDIVINDIWSMINKAGLVVAEISVHNANVFTSWASRILSVRKSYYCGRGMGRARHSISLYGDILSTGLQVLKSTASKICCESSFNHIGVSFSCDGTSTLAHYAHSLYPFVW